MSASHPLAGRLTAGLAALGLSLPPEAPERLLAFLRLLEKWNRTYNLTAVREPERMLGQHLLDSLSILPCLTALPPGPVLDVGAGGGLPGIPLAIARPDQEFCLIDTNSKKVAFLQQAAIELRLSNLAAHCARVEQWAAPHPFPVIVSRAFAEMADFIALTRRHLAPGGVWLAMKGVYPADEIARLPEDVRVREVLPLVVPEVEGQRHLVVVEPHLEQGKERT